MTALAEKTFGRYRLLRELGRGGEATVYLAEDPVLGRNLAIKIFPPAIAKSDPPGRFKREVSVLARIEHAGICAIHDAGVIEGSPFLAMSYVEGKTLAESAPSAPREAAALVARIAAIVQAAHAAGVVHGDLTPGNLLVAPDGRCFVLDFGVSRVVDDPAHAATGARLAGTLPYLAPECLAAPPTAASDVFGLGAVLFEMVAGRTPFAAPTRAALVERLLREDAPLLCSVDPRLPRDLEAVLARALQRDPARRYASMRAFEHDLERVAKGEPPEARGYGLLRRAGRWARRRVALASLLAFALLFLAVAVPVAATKNRSLEKYRDRAADEARQAVDDARAASGHVQRKERLADRRRLQDLEERGRRLVPPRPQIAADLASWLSDADALLRKLPEHRANLDELRLRGTKQEGRAFAPEVSAAQQREVEELRARAARLEQRSEASTSADERSALAASASRARSVLEVLESRIRRRDAWSYPSAADAWHDQTLSDLISDLERFADPDRARGMVADVHARLADASRVGDAIAQNREAWDLARASIADRRSCPLYDGLQIAPQQGLVPLRRNPSTGLWEFHHVLSGTAPRAGAEDVMTGDGGIVLVLVPGGTFTMGARRPGRPGEEGPNVDPMAAPEESPVDVVPLDSFFISKFELTVEQWERVRGSTPGPDWKPNFPRAAIDWFETKAALARIGLEIPTEAQWEYAARGGTTTPWWTGSKPQSLVGAEAFAERIPHRVGDFRPNGFGLFDVAGNLSEWCRDVFARYEDPRAAGDGERAGLDEAEHRPRRGGSYLMRAEDLRSARRAIESPAARRVEIGVRPARRLER